MIKNIVLTGGGSAGHVTPNLALIEALNATKEWQVAYVGGHEGIERDMIQRINIPFYGISTGKLRRYFSWENFLDPFRVIWGTVEAYRALSKTKAHIVFSKGGFVAFPVVLAAWLKQIPVIAHESDLSPGLANRLCFPFVKKICLTFSAAETYFKNKSRLIVTGTPLRTSLFHGSADRGRALCHFKKNMPCILVMGGGLGANKLNEVIRQSLDKLNNYQIVHLCGKGKVDLKYTLENYRQFEYIHEELPDLFAMADLVISRSGANSLYEILALQKPHILVPLSAKVSRGDQVQNAHFFEKLNISTVIDNDLLDTTKLLVAIDTVNAKADTIIANIQNLNIETATEKIIKILKEQSRD